ncbi:MAG TPA: 50S ribosomal protein L33 [Chloroflexota bacterium]
MARKSARVLVPLACAVCRRRNYYTTRRRTTTVTRLTLRKYCPWCRAHTEHREVR